MDYESYVNTKRIVSAPSGFDSKLPMHPDLFDFQADIVRWALRVGKAAVFADCGMGKGQPLDAKILTPHGWVLMGDIRVGTQVVGKDGLPHTVIGVYPRGIQPSYRVTFDDGFFLIVDADHLWNVKSANDKARDKQWRTMSTKELADTRLKYGSRKQSRTWQIPLVSPIDFPCSDHVIPPYALGVILGDGGITNHLNISTPDHEIVETIQSMLPESLSISHKDHYNYTVAKSSGVKSGANEWIDELRKLGLHGKLSVDKFIPDAYMFDSIDNRIALLQGLMDTDGYCSELGTPEFSTSSEQLAKNVAFLVQSLGGVCTISVRESPSYQYNGESKIGMPSFRLVMSFANDINPFRLKRKADRYYPSTRGVGRWIDSIEAIGDIDIQCIAVDAPDSLYVTEHCIVTHNTLIELEWSRHVIGHTGRSVMIFAPLGVARQTVREGAKFGYDVNLCLDVSDVKPGINITNYERLERFDPEPFAGIVLDESSILKGQFGKISKQLRDFAESIPFRLPASATPAPNDFEELIRHAEFLGIMTEAEIKALFFTQDGNSSNRFRLKGHAINHFWEWMASWAVAIRMPSDLNYDNGDFVLPPLHIHEHVVDVDAYQAGTLFAMEATTLQEQRQASRASIDDRVEMAASLVNASADPWIVWCNLNDESAALAKAIPDAIEVKGSDSIEHKEDALFGFADGRYRVLITKPSIAGFGMNFQHCAHAAYVGLSHSYEQFYQSIRRLYRFGQRHHVHAHIITSTADGPVVQNIKRKEHQAVEMFEQIVKRMAIYSEVHAVGRHEMEYTPTLPIDVPSWMKSYENPNPTKREPGILLYDFDDYVGFSVNGQLPTAMIADGEATQSMQLPSFIQER